MKGNIETFNYLLGCFLHYSLVSLREPFCLYCNKRNSIWERRIRLELRAVYFLPIFFSESIFYVFRDILCEKSYSMSWWVNWVLLWTSQVKLPVSSSSFISLSGKVHWVGKFFFKNNIVFNLGTKMRAVFSWSPITFLQNETTGILSLN